MQTSLVDRRTAAWRVRLRRQRRSKRYRRHAEIRYPGQLGTAWSTVRTPLDEQIIES